MIKVNLLSEDEIPDEALAELMHEVAVEAKEKADKADIVLKDRIKKEFEEALKNYNERA